jgi:hypothetical protein
VSISKYIHIFAYPGNFYYTLGNISPDKRATLNAIQLVAIVTSKHLKQYGIDTILDVIMNDIRQLEQVSIYFGIKKNGLNK